MHLRRWAVVVLIFQAAPACSQNDMDPKALAAVERSRTTDASYSLFLWNRVPAAHDQYDEEWSAEFHSGAMHRVEGPRNRIVANCETIEGTQLDLQTGKIDHDLRIAMGVCGVNANVDILSLEYLGPVNGPNGPAERVKLVDERHVRTYDIAANGALVRTTYHDREEELVSETTMLAMTGEASPDLFTEE